MRARQIYDLLVRREGSAAGAPATITHVFRRFEDFAELHSLLVVALANRNVPVPPFVPTTTEGRTQIRRIAIKRQSDMNQFLQRLLSAPPEVAQHDLLYTFCRRTPADEDEERDFQLADGGDAGGTNGGADGAGDDEDETSSTGAATRPTVLLRTLSHYRVYALYDFEPRYPDELGLRRGDTVLDVSASEDNPGWLHGQLCGKWGLFPASFVARDTGDPTTAREAD